jgi:tRNA-dihydrouridine synthase B
MLKIGDLQLSSRLILAPLSGISDLPFRMTNRTFGCKMAFTEMVSSHALVQNSGKTKKMLERLPGDIPLGVQLLGDDPEFLKRAIEIVNEHEFVLLDINAACPARKVTGSGKGATLMKDPQGLRELLKVVVSHSRFPVTVKIRAGWDAVSINAKEVALYAQDAGISGLFIHGRTKKQGYSGNVDYDVIREVKEALDIPVIGSGDVFSPILVKRMLDETGCDGVVIARGALGNPWIFRETEAFLKDGRILRRPDVYDRSDTILRHLDMLIDHWGEMRGVRIFRKFFAWYIKGLGNIKPLKHKGFMAVTRNDMVKLIGELQSVAGNG